MNLSLLTPPAAEPVTLSEAKAFLKFEEDDENDLILSLIATARQELEAATSRAFITQTWRLKLNRFSNPIRIPLAPLQTPLTAFTYIDSNGASQPLVLNTDYVLDTTSEPGLVRLAYGRSWPSTRYDYDVVTLDFVVGYGDTPDHVPEPLRTAIKMRVNDLFENRETTITGTIVAYTNAVERLIYPFKLFAFA